MTESLIQAYSNSPRRQKLQIIGSIFMTIVIAAVMLILYLVVSARVVSIGRQLQQAKDEIVMKIEKEFLISVLMDTGGNVSKAAYKIGMQRTNLHSLLKKYKIQSKTFSG